MKFCAVPLSTDRAFPWYIYLSLHVVRTHQHIFFSLINISEIRGINMIENGNDCSMGSDFEHVSKLIQTPWGLGIVERENGNVKRGTVHCCLYFSRYHIAGPNCTYIEISAESLAIKGFLNFFGECVFRIASAMVKENLPELRGRRLGEWLELVKYVLAISLM